MRISDWSSDVCSSDLVGFGDAVDAAHGVGHHGERTKVLLPALQPVDRVGVVALARGDDVAAAVTEVVAAHALEVVADRGVVRHASPRGPRVAAVGPGGHPPQRYTPPCYVQHTAVAL